MALAKCRVQNPRWITIFIDGSTSRQAALYRADKAFFTADGLVGATIDSVYIPLLEAMRNNAARSYLLADREKRDWHFKEYLYDFGELPGIISDYEFSPETKAKYLNATFICSKR